MRKYLSTLNTLSVNKKGFTLVELLVVITILAILMTIGIAVYSGVQKNARDLRRKSDLRSIKIALELYYQANGQYPSSTWVGSGAAPNAWISGLDSNYMSQGVPVDPFKQTSGNPWNNPAIFRYAYTSTVADTSLGACTGNYGGLVNGQVYVLAAQLENRNDADNIHNKQTMWCNGQTLEQLNWNASAYAITSL